MIRIISGLILAVFATVGYAAAEPLQLSNNAPASHTVVRGDTLWAISGKFLNEPWRWPELWRMNQAQIRNPHLIYPGDVIVLDRDAEGKPVLRLKSRNAGSKFAKQDDGKVRPTIYADAVEEAIPSIPPNELMPFISLPLVIEADGLNTSAKIVATQQDRVFLGNGDKAYVNDADPKVQNWQIYRPGKALKNPNEPERILGYEAFYLGTAKQLQPGQPATFEIVMAKEELGRGDRLIPAVRPELVAYMPHKPDTKIDGHIISIYGGVSSAGQGTIITIGRGSEDGLEIGHVLSIERNRTVTERDENDEKITTTIPPERVGLAFVFRTFQHVSYALVVQATASIDVEDFVRTP